jgi:transcriptional regulator with XRE-family HTH domain
MGVSTSSAAVGRAIRATRVRSNLSIARVARASALSPTELDGIENGRSRPSIAVLDRIARAIGSSLVDLVNHGGNGADSRIGRLRNGDTSGLALPDIAQAILRLSVQGGSKIDAVEEATVLHAMTECNENQSAAARLLGMERKAFVRRLTRARTR